MEPRNETAYRSKDDWTKTHGWMGPGPMGTTREPDGSQEMGDGTVTTHRSRSRKMQPSGKMEKREMQQYQQSQPIRRELGPRELAWAE